MVKVEYMDDEDKNTKDEMEKRTDPTVYKNREKRV